jgi:hypothetical protein
MHRLRRPTLRNLARFDALRIHQCIETAPPAMAAVQASRIVSGVLQGGGPDSDRIGHDRGQSKLPTCGQIDPHPSDRRSTVPLWCTVERREDRVEERKQGAPYGAPFSLLVLSRRRA